MLRLYRGDAALQESDWVGPQQLRKGRRHFLLAGGPAEQLVQQRLEHKAVALVNHSDLQVGKVEGNQNHRPLR